MTGACNGDTAARSGIHGALDDLVAGRSLSRASARRLMETVLAGQVTPSQLGGLLVALRVKGETVEEIAGFADGMRGVATPIPVTRTDLVDLCGTGGDRSSSINLSTTASLVAAAAGAAVAKHGNRSASSRCGSADVLEALGVPIDLEPARSGACLDELGFAFLFARLYHPAMRHAAATRAELGMRTVFNVLGPLSNPAGVRRQLLGVWDDAFRRPMAEVLRELGVERVWVVHTVLDGASEEGLDELSPCGTNRISEVRRGGIEEFELRPEDYGLRVCDVAALRGGEAAENARLVECVLEGAPGPHRDAVVLNAGAALVVAGIAADLREGLARAGAAIDGGAAQRLLEELRAWR